MSNNVETTTNVQDGESDNLRRLQDPIYEKYGQAIINDGKKLKFNETAVAHKFAEKLQIGYEPKDKQFLRYVAGAWLTISPAEVCGLISGLLRQIAIEYDHPEVSEKVKAATLNSIAKMLICVVKAPVMNAPKALFPVANGIVDLTGEKAQFIEHGSKYGFRWASSITYDKTATCPRFENELLKAGMTDEDISLVQRYAGSLLLGTNSAQRMLIMKGMAGAGKSTLVTILESIIGDHRTAYLRPKHLNGRFEFSGFRGKRLLCGKDLPGESLSEKGAKLIKSLIGGDKLEEETKYVAGKEKFQGDLHLIVHCNSNLRLALDGDEEAWRRRLLVVEYVRKSGAVITDFDNVLINAEASGILNWLVAGAEAHKAELKTGNFVLTETQKTRINSIIDESRSPLVFVQERVTKAAGKHLTVADAVAGYQKFCSSRNWVSLSEKQFQEALQPLMLKQHQSLKSHNIFPDKKDKPVRGYSGVQLVKA